MWFLAFFDLFFLYKFCFFLPGIFEKSLYIGQYIRSIYIGQYVWQLVKFNTPHPSSPHFWKISFDIEGQPEKSAFWNGERLPYSKNTTCSWVLACRWGDFRFLWKSRAFLVVLSGFGRFWAIFGRTRWNIMALLGTPLECKLGKKTEDHPS